MTALVNIQKLIGSRPLLLYFSSAPSESSSAVTQAASQEPRLQELDEPEKRYPPHGEGEKVLVTCVPLCRHGNAVCWVSQADVQWGKPCNKEGNQSLRLALFTALYYIIIIIT